MAGDAPGTPAAPTRTTEAKETPMHTKTFTTLAACAAFSGSAHAAITDIEIGGLEVIGVDVLSHQIDIVVAYQLTNVGDTTVDLRGPDTDSNDDDAAVQTYLATSPDLSGAVAASGCGVFFNPCRLFTSTSP